ncbi:MAG: hypothetical protein ACQEQS_10750 [Thermodesulfobacteriota bacterium]
MRKYFKNFLLILVCINFVFMYTGCTQKENQTEFTYSGKLASGERVYLKFYLYFNNLSSKNSALKRKSSYNHALNLMFSSYSKSQLSKPRLKNIVKKAGNRVFNKAVTASEIISIKYI